MMRTIIIAVLIALSAQGMGQCVDAGHNGFPVVNYECLAIAQGE